MKISLRSLQPLLILALAIGLIAMAFRQAPDAPKVLDEDSFIPRTEAVRYMALGHNSTAASLLWINGLISYGEGIMTGKSFRWITHLADASTRLDSLFKTPYTFIAAITPLDEKDTSDFPVLRRGIEKYPEDWQMALSFALRLSEGPSKDHAQAGRVMERYAHDTSIPPYAQQIYKSFYLRTQTTEIALTTIINDCLNPKYNAFIGSLYIKAIRVLNIKEQTHESRIVWSLLENLARGDANPEKTYSRLLAMKQIP